MAMRRSIVLSLAFVLLFEGCSRPLEGEQFLPGRRESYDFTLEVFDSLSRYDFSFYTRTDSRSELLRPLRLDVSWVSPQDSAFCETVYLRPDREKVSVQQYRTAVVFPSCGKWTLRVAASPLEKGFRGLGLIWKERQWDTGN